MRPVCNDKNCQSAKPVLCEIWRAKSSHMWSVPNTACKQIGTEPEVTRNNVHTVLPTDYHFVCQQALCEHSASKSCYPSETTEVSPVSRNYKKQSNHSDSRGSKMQSPQKRSVNPGKMQSHHMQPVQAEFQKKSQVNTKLQVQTST